jgi:hypothetical protein
MNCLLKEEEKNLPKSDQNIYFNSISSFFFARKLFKKEDV